MIAGVLLDLAALVAASGVLILCIAAYAIRGRLSHLTGEVAGVKITAEAVNKAVNNVPHGAKSLLDKIDDLHTKQDSFMAETDEWRATVDERLVRIEEHITRPTPRRKSA